MRNELSDMLDRNAVTHMLNVFQQNLDSFNVPLLSYSELEPIFSERELRVLDAVLQNVTPTDLSLQRYPYEETILATLQLPAFALAHQKKFVRVSDSVNKAFTAMAAKLKADTGKEIMIVSGYRSPVYHALLLCGILYKNNFDLQKTLREIQPPMYSEHQDIQKPAIDISDIDQSLPNEMFVADIYPWLDQHAKEYGFVESYPKTQNYMIWEPWHWKLV